MIYYLGRITQLSMTICLLIFYASTILLASTPIRIGVSAPLSGASKQLGKSILEGSEAYINSVNKKGGVHARQLDLIILDDKYDPQLTIQHTIQFIHNHQVDLLFSYVGTPTVKRILPLLRTYKKQHMLLFFPFTGAQLLRQEPALDYVYNLRASYFDETKAIVDRYIAEGITRIAVFYQNDSYGRNGWQGVRRALQEHDLTIVSDASYARGATINTSCRLAVEHIFNQNPQGVILIASYQAATAFIQEARQQGHLQNIAMLSFVDPEQVLLSLSKLEKTDQRRYTDNLVFSHVLPHYQGKSLAARRYRQLMDANNIDYSFAGFEGYLNAVLLVKLLKSVPVPVTSQSLYRYLEKQRRYYIGIGSPIILSHRRHQALDKVYFTTIKEGQFVSWQH